MIQWIICLKLGWTEISGCLKIKTLMLWKIFINRAISRRDGKAKPLVHSVSVLCVLFSVFIFIFLYISILFCNIIFVKTVNCKLSVCSHLVHKIETSTGQITKYLRPERDLSDTSGDALKLHWRWSRDFLCVWWILLQYLLLHLDSASSTTWGITRHHVLLCFQ